MSKHGVLTFKQKDRNSRFMYSFKISNYHAAKILEYLAGVPHKAVPPRDAKGRFITLREENK